jgi:ribosomal protein L31
MRQLAEQLAERHSHRGLKGNSDRKININILKGAHCNHDCRLHSQWHNTSFHEGQPQIRTFLLFTDDCTSHFKYRSTITGYELCLSISLLSQHQSSYTGSITLSAARLLTGSIFQSRVSTLLFVGQTVFP